MVEGGFGFHGVWGNLIQWINRLDIDKIREKAGVRENTEPGAAPSRSKAPGYLKDDQYGHQQKRGYNVSAVTP